MSEMSQERTSKMYDIWIIAKANFFYAEYFANPKSKLEKDYLERSPHFRIIAHSMFRTVIIELAKLVRLKLSRNEKFSLMNFFNEFKKEHKGEIDGNYKTVVELECYFLKKKEFILEVLTLRDELYSHYDGFDKNYNECIELINFNSLGEFIQEIGQMIKELASIYEFDVELNKPFDDNRRFQYNDLRILAEFQQKQNNRPLSEKIEQFLKGNGENG